MSKHPRTAAAKRAAPAFTPVPVRPRHDGWTPEKQMDFIAALAATGSVSQACKGVGMSPRAAYDLYNRRDAGSFRSAWDMAVRHCYAQLSTAMLSRAIHGAATPIFYKGEQVGEKRTYDNRLGMWMLGKIAPDRFGAWRDGFVFRQDNPDAATGNLHKAMRNLAQDLLADERGQRRPVRARQPLTRFEDGATEESDEDADRRAKFEEGLFTACVRERMDLISRGEIDGSDPDSYRRWKAGERRKPNALEMPQQRKPPPDSARDAS